MALTEQEKDFALDKQIFLRKWSDSRPTKQCEPCKAICEGLGQQRCSICYSPSYWWATRDGCPKKRGRYVG